MTKALRQFIQRAPRYVLNADDNRMLRFARDRKQNQYITTEILNISESGLLFDIDRRAAPQIGEIIKIEFAVPGSEETLAWFARVIRIELPEEISSWKVRSNSVRVAVRFEQLPSGHAGIIRTQLRKKFEQILYERKTRAIRESRRWIREHAAQLIIYTALTILSLSVLYILSRPSANYDEHNPSIWGERFK